MSFSTPDSYLEEQTVRPLSISPGATALAVFIGYTQKAIDSNGNDLTDVLTPIGSLLDYEAYFGSVEPAGRDVQIDAHGNASSVGAATTRHYLFHSVDLYFRNGGGSCFILSIGRYSDPVAWKDFDRGLGILKQDDRPTLMVLADAVNLGGADYYMLARSALEQCSELKDRFAILDVKDNDVATFRNSIGGAGLGYGAAYYPYLNTTSFHPYDESRVPVKHGYGLFEIQNCIRISYDGRPGEGATISIAEAAPDQADVPRVRVAGNGISLVVGAATGSPPAAILDAWNSIPDPGKFDMTVAGTGQVLLAQQQAEFAFDEEIARLGDGRIKIDNPSVYDSVVSVLEQQKISLPPGGAVAAAYSKTDLVSGPWKAPANIAINDVTGPVADINNTGQEYLNNSPDGKSINALRSFVNQGTLIWGARTLDGHSNEWRYIPVRRLFIKVESDIRRATAFSVFEPNNAFTWLKIRTMLIGYLDELWSAGALNGASAEEAYFIRLGLGETMDDEDIRAGRLHISVGIAAARPAEFVVMTITHILQGPDG